MQNTKPFKSVLLFMLMLIFLLSSTGCVKNATSLSKLSEGEYLVAFSRAFSKPARLVIYQGDDTKLEDIYVKDGQALGDSVKSEDDYLFVSQRINTHYLIDRAGNITPVSFAADKYTPDRHGGTFFTVYSQGWLISAMNIGSPPPGYACELIIQKGLDGPQKYLSLNLGILDTAVVNGNILYVHYLVVDSLDPDSVNFGRYAGIYAYDLTTGQEIFDVAITNRSLASLVGKPITTYHNYILLYGDSTDNPFEAQPPCLGVFDTISYKLIREVYFDGSFLPASLNIYQDKIYLMSADGKMKVLDSNFDTVQEYQLADNALENYSDREPFIGKTILQGSELHVVYRFSPQQQNYQLPASIHVYDVETGKLKRVTDLKLEGETSWWAEYFDVQLITNK